MTTFSTAIDFDRMRRERSGKVQQQMARAGFDALVLASNSAVRYATGAEMLIAEPTRGVYEPTVAVITLDGATHLFTPCSGGAPPSLSADHVHLPLLTEFDEGVEALSGVLKDLLGPSEVRVGFDDMSAAEMELFPKLMPQMSIGDAGEVLGPAKILKTDDEVECIHRAQRINELAMYDTYTKLRPGIRQSELSSIFLRRIFELGASANVVDPIWTPVPFSIADGPFTVHGDVAFPTVSTDRILRQDDLVMVDTGIMYEGYSSDFGRTWIVGDQPTARQMDQFRRWKDVVKRVLAVIRPGATGLELNRAAREAPGARRPWLDHFYLIHGVGTDSAEMPLIGTDLGEEFDESIILAPGMVMVMEPVIWDDSHGGYRAEEIFVVTEDGYRCLSAFPYWPYEEGIFPW